MASSDSDTSDVPQISAVKAARNSGLIKSRIEYISSVTPGVVPGLDEDEDPSDIDDPAVLEYVEVRLTREAFEPGSAKKRNPRQYHSHSKGNSYITILSPAVNEALRCVVDYYPNVDLSGDTIRVYDPFCIFVFYEKELTEYRNRLAPYQSDDRFMSCKNRHAYEHIGVVQQFVKQRVQKDVDAERERHSRGYATFDMLWLLYKPGMDYYTDIDEVGEHEPWVLDSLNFSISNGTINRYEADWWKLCGVPEWVGPYFKTRTIRRFAGEKEIVSMASFPCEYVSRSSEVGLGDAEDIRQHFVDRGRKWYDVHRRKKCYQFDGFTEAISRSRLKSLVMVDTETLHCLHIGDDAPQPTHSPSETVARPTTPLKICGCSLCETQIYRHAVKAKFTEYSKFSPVDVEELTDHQYFICDNNVQAFAFKLRVWQFLHISGFKEAEFNTALFEKLVLNESIKKIIKDLTEMYIRDTAKPVSYNNMYNRLTSVHKQVESKVEAKTWSADFVQGKGKGLTILLHGKPGVGKTYTAGKKLNFSDIFDTECIADYTKRPLLSLTCSDLGVDPETIEHNLINWFDMAQEWGAIILIDEADIFMEERQPQDLTRNHLVAGFLRALEYFDGILFLTTNRVGTFDEAFISRIDVPIYYGEFTPEQRMKVWENFFEKLELDRDSTMRILSSVRDYVASSEMQNLKWNGREIRNAFQVAVALAEAQGQKDDNGRVLIKKDHIKATLDMSKEFSDYLKRVHKADMSKKAAMMGTRFDAFSSETGSTRNLFG